MRSASTKPSSCKASTARSWISISDEEVKTARPLWIDETRFLASTCDSLDQDWDVAAAYCPNIFETACMEVLISDEEGEWTRLGARIDEMALRGEDSSLKASVLTIHQYQP